MKSQIHYLNTQLHITIQGVREERECDWSRVSKACGLKEDAIERLPVGRRPPVKLRQRPKDVLPQGVAHAT